MPTVILRGSKNGRAVSRLVLEGSSSNPIREAFLNGDPFEVSDEEFDKLDRAYALEPADKQDDTDQPPPRLVAATEQEDEPEKGGVK